MRCPKCGKDVELQNKQVGVDENGKPIFNEYAICRDCRKQWNLDKKKAKKAATTSASEHTQATETKPNDSRPAPKAAEKKKAPEPQRKTAASEKKAAPARKPAAPDPDKRPVKKAPDSVPANRTVYKDSVSMVVETLTKGAAPEQTKPEPPKNPVPSADRSTASPKRPASAKGRPAPKKRPASTEGAKSENGESPQKYANIPPEKVRVKREKVVRQNYEEMLATDPNRKPVKKKPAPQEAPAKKKPAAAEPVRRKPEPADDYSMDEGPAPRFQLLRIVFGVVSLAAFAFFAYKGFMTGLNNISSGKNAATGTIYIVLALCMLISGLLHFILRNKNTIFAFLIPTIFYLGGAVFAFIKRGDDKFLLIGAAVGAVLGVLFLILTFASRSGDEDGDFEDDYDDPFEEDHDNY